MPLRSPERGNGTPATPREELHPPCVYCSNTYDESTGADHFRIGIRPDTPFYLSFAQSPLPHNALTHSNSSSSSSSSSTTATMKEVHQPLRETLEQLEKQQPSSESMAVVAKNLAIDVAAAATASFAVSPFITIVDRAIIENASGARPLATGVKELAKAFVANPFQFIRKREFAIVFGLYTATYASANAIDTICEWTESDNQMPKFLGTTAVNMSLCIAKDRAFAQMFGVVAPSAFPIGAIGLFAVRDSLTVAASFNAPKSVAKKLEDDAGVEPSRAKTIAQLLCPALVQFVSTPLHLLGLDLYNSKGASAAQHMRFVQREYVKSAVARIGRIGPAFGIGGVGNTYCRENLRAAFN